MLLVLSQFFIQFHKVRTVLNTTATTHHHILVFMLPSQTFKAKAKFRQYSSKPFQKSIVFQGLRVILLWKRDLILYFKGSAYIRQQHERITH